LLSAEVSTATGRTFDISRGTCGFCGPNIHFAFAIVQRKNEWAVMYDGGDNDVANGDGVEGEVYGQRLE
jgi:hypothetical protein